MEYALEGYGFSAARMVRSQLSRSRGEGHPPRDSRTDLLLGMLERDYGQHGDDFVEIVMEALFGKRLPELENPPELLSTLRALGPSGPVKGLALTAASATKAAFDRLQQSLELRLTLCSLDSDPGGGAHLRLAVYLPRLTAEVRADDEVTAGALVALHGLPGEGGCRLEVVPRLYRKICENGMVVSLGDARGHELDLTRLLLAKEETPLVRALADAIHSCLDEKVFMAAVSSARRSVNDLLDVSGRADSLVGSLSPEVRSAVLLRYGMDDDLTRWGLVNAVTAEARGASSELALSLERLGGELARQPVAQHEHVPLSASLPFAKKRSAA